MRHKRLISGAGNVMAKQMKYTHIHTYIHLYIQLIKNISFFFRNTLCDPEVIRYINTYTLFWACNVKSGEGYKVAEALKSSSYPFLALIVLKDNRMTIVGRYVKLMYKYFKMDTRTFFKYVCYKHKHKFFLLTDWKERHHLLI